MHSPFRFRRLTPPNPGGNALNYFSAFSDRSNDSFISLVCDSMFLMTHTCPFPLTPTGRLSQNGSLSCSPQSSLSPPYKRDIAPQHQEHAPRLLLLLFDIVFNEMEHAHNTTTTLARTMREKTVRMVRKMNNQTAWVSQWARSSPGLCQKEHLTHCELLASLQCSNDARGEQGSQPRRSPLRNTPCTA